MTRNVERTPALVEERADLRLRAKLGKLSAPVLRWLRLHPWLVTGVCLLAIFLVNNLRLVNGADAPNWDASIYYAPEFSLVADHARAGRLVFWDPWVQGGSPDHADPQVGAASPLMIAIGALTGGTESGFRVYWLFIWFLGPLGILLLARHLNVPCWTAFVVSLGYAFCGFYTGHAEHTTFVYSFSFLPVICWRLDVALQSGGKWPAAQAGALWGLSALGGYPSLTILTAGFLGLWSFGRCFSTLERDNVDTQKQHLRTRLMYTAITFGIVVCVGVLVLAPTYVAFFTEGLGYSERAGGLSRQLAVEGGEMSPGSLLNFASPYLILLKYPGLNPTLWPQADLTLMAIYIGVLPLILALFAIIERPRSAWRWWLIGIILLALACALGDHLPVRGWLYDYCPPTRYFRHVGSFRAFAIFGVMILALLAGDDLRRATAGCVSQSWMRFFFSTWVMAIAAVVSYIHVISHVKDLQKEFQLANWHLGVMWLICIATSLLVLLSRNKRRWLPVVFVVLAIGDATLTRRISEPLVSGGPWARQVWSKLLVHQSSLDLTKNGLEREVRAPAWVGNGNFNYSLVPKIPTLYNDPTLRNRFHLDFANHPVLLNMGVGKDRVWFASEVATVNPSDNAYEAVVQRSESIGGPVFVIHSLQQMLSISRGNLAVKQVKDQPPQSDLEIDAISQLPAARRIPNEVLRYTPNHLDLVVSCPDKGWLLITDRWSRGWRATVNGHPSEVFGGDFIFRAVRVDKGLNTIRFCYFPISYVALLVLSWGTLLAVFVVWPIVRYRSD